MVFQIHYSLFNKSFHATLMSSILKTHRVLKKEETLFIHLNIPEDCVYDVSYIIVQYEPEKEVKILSDDLPESIKENMIKYFKGDIEDFIDLVESNLEVFLSGSTPDIQVKIPKHSQPVMEKDQINKLPDSYQFPINKLTFNNLNVQLDKKNIHFLTCKKPIVEVQCKGCKRSKTLRDTCVCDCGNNLRLNFVPVLDSEYLGSIFLDCCTFICLNPSQFQFNCDKCGANFESNKVGLGNKFIMNCWECDTLLSFVVKKVIYIEKKTQVFKKGEELPNKGACKHYKKSFRWFRFPCCGSVYPCDICHDVEANHEHKIANKMICGLCSKEQSVKKDCECGMTLKKSTNCWEGGKGNRNKLSMSKKDKKKYTK